MLLKKTNGHPSTAAHTANLSSALRFTTTTYIRNGMSLAAKPFT